MDVDTVNTISLSSLQDSAITNVNLYATRAQITRVYKANVLTGQNKVTITSLPNVVDHESLRVESIGPAIIQGVTASKVDIQEREDTSPLLDELEDKKLKTENTLERCRKALKAIDTYVGKLDVEHLEISKLGEAMDVYDSTGEEWEDKIILVKKEIVSLNKKIKAEELRLEGKVGNKKLRTQVVVGLYAESAGEVEITVIYAVSHASWDAGYDIRVDMQDPTQLATVVYKASISQTTGEIWENAPITLETTNPTFGLDIPVLPVWNLSLENPARTGTGLGRGGAKRHRKILPDEDDLEYDEHQVTQITSTGSVNATFRIPGRTTIPTDGEEHSVTIADLKLDAKVTWVCIPKTDTRGHLEANIKNSSDYTFLSGTSNVYVDRSFIAQSDVPNVGPQAMFHCPLGCNRPFNSCHLPPKDEDVVRIRFYNKSRTQSFSQRITVQNTKSIAIEGLKITDHIPVSQDENITVNLISPALVLPTTSALKLIGQGTPPKVQVSEGIVAQWNGSDDPNGDLSALGRHGRIDWLCAIPAFGTVNLELQWEVISNRKAEIYGL
ncbi:hypothetical protein M413DRAFT_25436 [Hebeloma cylindrosporum]|uniref:DUF4139 domain-containing protein n=1 Tax=Hebeloma cylindrosporum TaxID=76867 RepID=A0A0C3C4X4_HEBCY|nr:hypothetical protein M413DRAFT_25436 [Hebeloma cylindrosporum h7]